MTRTIDEYRAQLKAMLPELAEKFGVAELGLFGSRVRGDNRDDSDLDVLVTFRIGSRVSLFTIGGLATALEDGLGVPVDLAIKDNLEPRLRPYILREELRV